jgi:hypothetical protein
VRHLYGKSGLTIKNEELRMNNTARQIAISLVQRYDFLIIISMRTEYAITNVTHDNRY